MNSPTIPEPGGLTSASSIEPLQGPQNYSTWLLDIRALLRLQKLWVYTQHKAPRYGGVSVEHDAKKHQEWTAGQEMAADIITRTLSTDIKKALVDQCELEDDNDCFNSGFLAELDRLNHEISCTEGELTPAARALICLDLALPEEFDELVNRWRANPPKSYFEAVRQLKKEHSGMKPCGHCHRRHPESHCCVCPKTKYPHSVEQCWKLNPELRPARLRREKRDEDEDGETSWTPASKRGRAKKVSEV